MRVFIDNFYVRDFLNEYDSDSDSVANENQPLVTGVKSYVEEFTPLRLLA